MVILWFESLTDISKGMSNGVMVTTPLLEAMESANLPRGGVQAHKLTRSTSLHPSRRASAHNWASQLAYGQVPTTPRKFLYSVYDGLCAHGNPSRRERPFELDCRCWQEHRHPAENLKNLTDGAYECKVRGFGLTRFILILRESQMVRTILLNSSSATHRATTTELLRARAVAQKKKEKGEVISRLKWLECRSIGKRPSTLKSTRR
eukprot:1177803-Prorocentrum_minimum.AAC.1